MAASRCIAEAMNSRQRASPIRNAPASRGTQSDSDQIQTERKSESGATRRRPRRPAKLTRRTAATPSTGDSVRRMRWVEPRMRSAIRTVTTAKMRITRSSRSGRTTSSISAGSRGRDHEGVARAAAEARAPRGRLGVALDQQRGREEQGHRDDDERSHDGAIEAAVQPAGREGEDQVDEQRLDRPGGDPPDRVELRRRRLGQGGEEDDRAGRDEQRSEAPGRRPPHRVEADRDRRAHRRAAGDGGEPGGVARRAGSGDRGGDRAQRSAHTGEHRFEEVAAASGHRPQVVVAGPSAIGLPRGHSAATLPPVGTPQQPRTPAVHLRASPAPSESERNISVALTRLL